MLFFNPSSAISRTAHLYLLPAR